MFNKDAWQRLVHVCLCVCPVLISSLQYRVDAKKKSLEANLAQSQNLFSNSLSLIDDITNMEENTVNLLWVCPCV